MLFRPEMETDLVNRQLEQHVASALDTKEFASDPNDVRVEFGWSRVCASIELRSNETLKRGEEVNISCRLFLYGLENVPLATGDYSVYFVINFTRLRM